MTVYQRLLEAYGIQTFPTTRTAYSRSMYEDETFSKTEEDTETEENAVKDDDNVVPFG